MTAGRNIDGRPDAVEASYAAAAFGFDFAAQAMRFWAGAAIDAMEMSQRMWSASQAATGRPSEAALPALRERAKALKADKAISVERKAKPALDDLKAIPGVGPKLEQMLRDTGVTSYAQIAAWSAEEIAGMDRKFGFSGRIARDGWVEAARKLVAAQR